DVAGKEAEPLTGLHRGAREDDAVDVLALECLHRERDREIALAGPGRPDRERHRVRSDGVDVPLLPCGLRPHGLPATQDLGGARIRRSLVAFQHLDGAPGTLAVELVTRLEERDHLLEETPDAFGLRVVAPYGDLVATHVNRDGERVFDEPQQLVALTE